MTGVTGAAAGGGFPAQAPPSVPTSTSSVLTGVTLSDHAGGQAHNNMQPFVLGSFYMKL